MFEKLLKGGSTYSPYHEVDYFQKGRILAIGDIHGCLRTFNKLLDKIGLEKGDQLFLLGDYVNKGPDSAGVLTKIIDLILDGYLIYPLRGNHESMALEELEEKGGLFFYPDGELVEEETLKHPFSVYCCFLRNLPYYYRIEDIVMVHAGLNLALEDPFSDYETMMWVWDFAAPKGLGYRVVHGHTNIFLQFIESSVEKKERAVNLDNGCYKKGEWGKGNLIALDIHSNKLFVQENID